MFHPRQARDCLSPTERVRLDFTTKYSSAKNRASTRCTVTPRRIRTYVSLSRLLKKIIRVICVTRGARERKFSKMNYTKKIAYEAQRHGVPGVKDISTEFDNRWRSQNGSLYSDDVLTKTRRYYSNEKRVPYSYNVFTFWRTRERFIKHYGKMTWE